MRLYDLDPLSDRRWDDLVASHPRASVFHRTGWLRALATTYGYRTMVLTTSPPGERLRDGVVFCEVRSWITGSRMVSLPFSDHAEPLLSEDGATLAIAEWMQAESLRRKWRYIELRPLSEGLHYDHPLAKSQSYWLHTLDLSPSVEQIFAKLHKSCIQRRIRHAERERLGYERGCSSELLNEFYTLLMMTRRRFRLLPQPRAWFENLIACMAPNAEIRVARKDGKAVAAILTLGHRGTVVYKYGCSDERFHHLGGMPFLFWKLIEESKNAAAELIDFGRTELENDHLTEFKDRLGTRRSKLSYLRYPERAGKSRTDALNISAMRGLFSILPDALSSRLGWAAYRHIG
jgi:CelD/BcsL family acetyltransferase involved in cellulose biosynthesis